MEKPITSVVAALATTDPAVIVPVPGPDKQKINCLRCGCAGTVDLVPSEAWHITNDACACLSCSQQGCVHTAIRTCLSCSRPYELVADVSGKCSFQCTSACSKFVEAPSKRFLRLRGKDPNAAMPPWNRTLLHSAVLASDVQLVWYLLHNGANPFVGDYKGTTPIDLAHYLLDSISAENSHSGASTGMELCDRVHTVVKIFPMRCTASVKASAMTIPSAPVLGRGGSDTGTRGGRDAKHLTGLLPIPPKTLRHISAPTPVKSFSLEPVRVLAPEVVQLGSQPFTPLTIVRLTSGSEVAPVVPEALLTPSVAPAGVNIKAWRRSELCQIIAEYGSIKKRGNWTPKMRSQSEVLFHCSACYDTLPIEGMRYSCSRMGCTGCLCTDCLIRLVYVTITSCLYAVPAVRCPGTCMHRIPTSVWREALRNDPAPPDMHDTISRLSALNADSTYDEAMTAEELLMERYSCNAEALLMMRCSCCDMSAHLFYAEKNGDHILTTTEERMSFLDDFMASIYYDDIDGALSFLQLLIGYYNGEVAADVLMPKIVHAYSLASSLTADELLPEKPLDENMREMLKTFLCSIVDIERRLCAQLTLFRMYPKIYTPCCDYEHCFMCKIEGHHDGETCEEVQQKETGIEVEYCPGCGVPTLRTEGCDEILCVCGQSWTWEGEDLP